MEITVSKAEYEALSAENTAQKEQINALRFELDQLKRMLFGFKSEKRSVAPTPEQLELWGLDQTKVADVDKEKVSYERKKPRRQPHPGRSPLPDHLPRRKVIIEPEQDLEGMIKIGEDITEKVNYVPGVLEVIQYVRPRYARPEAEQGEDNQVIVQAPAPLQVLPKSIVADGLLVQIMIAKFIDHLPLYRQRAMFKRDYDWDIPSSTIGDWFSSGTTLLRPLYIALLEEVMKTTYLQGDESRITVLQTGKEKPKNKSHKRKSSTKPRQVHLGYMWVFRNPVKGLVMFAYRKGRGAQVLHETLNGYSGLLQSDGYIAYSSYDKNNPEVTLVSCLAHIRRKFFDARSNDGKRANLALDAIGYLYRIERICRDYGVSVERRRRLRDRYARPAYDGLLSWVREQQRNNLTKSGIGKALGYAANHLPRLAAYLDDGRVEIDNNQIENKIRPLALGRKNYLFAGSNEAAERVAMMYSFFASCADHGVNPREWLLDVLPRLAHEKIEQPAQLLPGAWKADREAAAKKK